MNFIRSLLVILVLSVTAQAQNQGQNSTAAGTRTQPGAQARNSTTAGSLTLSSTFESISVRAGFSDDSNENNSATIQFRRQGDTVWKNALNPIIDRRTRISRSKNPYASEARGSIVGLTPGTTYEVSLSFVDPDGVSGSPLTGVVKTISPAPLLSGKQIFVDDVSINGDGSSLFPYSSISSALSAAVAGDTIVVRAGTYSPFTVSKSGSSSGYIALVGESRDQVFINSGSSDSIDVNGSYIQLKNLRLKKLTNHNGIAVDGYNHVWIENVYIEDIFTTNSYDAGVSIRNSTDVYVLDSEIYSPSLTAYPAAIPRWASTGEGIFVGANVRNLVIRGNIVIGGYLDCIGNSPEGWGGGAIENSDIAYNSISGCKDDGIQMEGDDVNLRIYGNLITANNGYSAIAMAPALVGPVYVFRNVLRQIAGFAGSVFKLESNPSFTFYIHNTIDTEQDNDGLASPGPNVVVNNNILRVTTNPVNRPDGAGKYNGNLYYRATPGPIIRAWNGGVDYYTVTDFRIATGQEQKGKQGDPLFTDPEKHISSSSPAFDAGIVISNFNDEGSAWLFKGAAPDMGAFEVN